MKYPSVLSNAVLREWMIALQGWLYEFFNPELDGYTNFDFGSGGLINVRIIIFGIFGGVLLASLYTIYIKNVVGAFVRKLRSEECLSQDRAKTLEELGFSKNPFIRAALRGSLLASTVIHVEEESTEQGTDAQDQARKGKSSAESLSKTRYYIKEEKKYAAELRFRAGGRGWPTFFFVLLISLICVVVIFAFLPQILRFIDNTVSIFSVAGNTVK